MKTPKITRLGASSATFTTESGRELELKAFASAVHGELDLGGGDSSVVWNGDAVAAAAERAEFLALLTAIQAGKAARVRLGELAGEFERDIRARIAEADADEAA
jgi:hypothetical protein